MVVTPKANDLTGRKDSRGYIKIPWSDEVLNLASDQVTARKRYELVFITNPEYIPNRAMNMSCAVYFIPHG